MGGVFLLAGVLLRRKIRLLVLLSLLLAGGGVQAGRECEMPLRGINLVPLPSGWYKGAPEFVFPTDDHIAYYKRVGMNAIRLPIVWENMQPELKGNLDVRYLSHTLDFIKRAGAHDMKVVIDLHNYGRYRGELVGSVAVSAESFGDFWTRVARIFSRFSAVYGYGLMNEPHDTNGLWHKVAQAGVDGIREVDRDRMIFVGGDSWSNPELWPKVNPSRFVVDPSNRVTYEAHLYLDDDFSGKYRSPAASTDVERRVEKRLKPFIDWLASKGERGVIGEVGVPMEDPRWLAGLQRFLDMSDEACLDWFMWAGGAWRADYELSLEPINGGDRPQVELIRRHMARSRK